MREAHRAALPKAVRSGSVESGLRCPMPWSWLLLLGTLPFSEMIDTSLRPTARPASGKPWSAAGRAPTERPFHRSGTTAESKGVAVIAGRCPPARRSEPRIASRPDEPVSLDQTDHRVEPTTARSDVFELGSRTAGGDCRYYVASRRPRGRSKGSAGSDPVASDLQQPLLLEPYHHP
jgi:hypothetical protein